MRKNELIKIIANSFPFLFFLPFSLFCSFERKKKEERKKERKYQRQLDPWRWINNIISIYFFFSVKMVQIENKCESIAFF